MIGRFALGRTPVGWADDVAQLRRSLPLTTKANNTGSGTRLMSGGISAIKGFDYQATVILSRLFDHYGLGFCRRRGMYAGMGSRPC
ncbi:MAG: hypothetical protein WB611_09800 [Stellaceae bacterium]